VRFEFFFFFFFPFNILFDVASYRPQNYKELYNLPHSSLRTAIERTFGVLKKRFPILSARPAYPFPVQVNLVVALFALSNFIKIVGGDRNDVYNQEWTEEATRRSEMAEGEDGCWNTAERVSDDEKRIAKERRDNIAKAMWKDYEQTLKNRGVRRSGGQAGS